MGEDCCGSKHGWTMVVVAVLVWLLDNAGWSVLQVAALLFLLSGLKHLWWAGSAKPKK